MNDKPALPVVTDEDSQVPLGDLNYAQRLLEFELDPQNFLSSMRARRRPPAQRLVDALHNRRVII